LSETPASSFWFSGTSNFLYIPEVIVNFEAWTLDNIIQWCIYYFGKCLTCARHTRLEHRPRLVLEVWCYRYCETRRVGCRSRIGVIMCWENSSVIWCFSFLYCSWRFVCHGILSLGNLCLKYQDSTVWPIFTQKLHTLLPLLYWWILFLFHDHVLVETCLYFDLEYI
jgi:hypothetical protein